MALQEFLASYAVQVDEDGARRLQRILDQNREAGQQLAEVFSAAAEAISTLKRELSQSSGLRTILPWLTSSARLPSSFPRDASGLYGSSGQPGSASLAGLSTSPLSSGFAGGFSGPASMSVGADFSAADEAFSAFRSRLETERPNIRVNTSGITSAVSSAIASVRSMLSSVQVTVPVKAVASLDVSGLSSGGGGGSGGTNRKPGGSDSILNRYGLGGRVASPTLAMIAEEGKPEYVIPTDNEARAVPLLHSLLDELSASARASVFAGAVNPLSVSLSGSSGSYGSYGVSGASAVSGSVGSASAGPLLPNVQAPVNIYVSSSASPEAVGRTIYDTAQRSLLKTLKGVFA